MKPSIWNAPEPTTVSSAILFHCSTVLPGGRTTEAVRPSMLPERSRRALATGTTTAIAARATASDRADVRMAKPGVRRFITVSLRLKSFGCDQQCGRGLLHRESALRTLAAIRHLSYLRLMARFTSKQVQDALALIYVAHPAVNATQLV